MIRKKILHYYILDKSSEGRMGVIYLAGNTNLKRKVALKFLPHHISANEEERKYFEIETQAAAELNHASGFSSEVITILYLSTRKVISSPNGTDSTGNMQSWGGITLYRFDDDGKISAEIGEEGAPGPFERSSVYPGTD